MSIFKSEKLSLAGSKWAAMVLVVFFGMTALLGSPIHDHDLDPAHHDPDCSSCYLVNANIGLEEDKQDLLANSQTIYSVLIETKPIFIVSRTSVSSRAPPVIC